ncbi:SLBB domain-containing protein [Xylanibacter ruminicola]|uniref:Protein involved in polysaccharide export, contains SLBB domain of the beta-grasp fold n=1 Tax=Xylanibacter ruminicola TaxID=839 RepID=A0A1M6RBR1_XYLRU|nr:SLBB domain-containing protein [Xylanibacter ruminicola]SHK29891.1 protein involved in polysaccharide export, contains SLBB domain of the beta-grasp fold [Xylanibacter ruminicola]
MKKILLSMLCVFASVAMWGQSISDQELVKYALELRKSGVSNADMMKQLMERGATVEQLQRLRQQYSKQITERGLDNAVDNSIDNAKERMRVNNEVKSDKTGKTGRADQTGLTTQQSGDMSLFPDVDEQDLKSKGKKVFGRDIFNSKNLSFEPQMNIATPQNYVLGPGDQLIIDIYGASQESNSLTVSPDGDVTVPDFGPIHVSGLSVASAQKRIRSKLGGYYQSSDIKVTVGQTRTIMVNVMGEVKVPGTYTLSAFATVFHALYMAGGISDLGTLRAIKVFRQGRLITTVDVYEFILNGRLAGNIRLQDNDVVQVGAYDCLVDITGRVKRPMAYEMKANESLATLLKYSGGFAGDAYKKQVRVLRKSEDLKSVYNVEEFDMSSFKMTDGDSVIVDSVYNRYKNMVEIKGAVWRPGMYQLGEKVSTVRSLIETASGLTEEAMTSRAVMRRMKPNRTQEVISLNIDGILNGTEADVPLKNEDVIFIPTLAAHQNLRTLTIDGEVIFPGTYEYADNMTIEDFILLAGGLTDAASTLKVDVSRRIYDPNASGAGMEIAKTFSFPLKNNFNVDGDRSFVLEPYDIVQVRKSPVYQNPVRVGVEGEVAFQGTYTMETKNQRLSDVIKAAGGAIAGSDVRGARLVRRMTADEKARMQAVLRMARQSADGKDSIAIDKIAQSDTYTVGIHLDEALANPGSTQDIELMDGDRLIVPRFNHTVRISGDVNAPNTVAFNEGQNYKYYVKQAGGFGNRAKKSHTYIVYQNGTMAVAKKGGKIEPGCEIVVPSKAPRDDNAISRWLGIGTSAASLATMFATIANLVK